MPPSTLTGFDPRWTDEGRHRLVLVNGEDKHETRSALERAGHVTSLLGVYRGFFWYRVDDDTLLCVCGVGPPNVELAVVDASAHGVDTIVRMGTCGALAPDLAVGDVVVASEGVAFHDGVASVGAHRDEVHTPASASVLKELEAASERAGGGGRSGVVMGTPFFHDPPATPRGDRYRELCTSGSVDAIDMETGTLFWLGAHRGLETGSVVGVANDVGETHLEGAVALDAAGAVVGAWLDGLSGT